MRTIQQIINAIYFDFSTMVYRLRLESQILEALCITTIQKLESFCIDELDLGFIRKSFQKFVYASLYETLTLFFLSFGLGKNWIERIEIQAPAWFWVRAQSSDIAISIKYSFEIFSALRSLRLKFWNKYEKSYKETASQNHFFLNCNSWSKIWIQVLKYKCMPAGH